MVFASAIAGPGFASASAGAGFAPGPCAFRGGFAPRGFGFAAFGGFPPVAPFPPVGILPPPVGIPGGFPPPIPPDPAQAGDHAADRVLRHGGGLERANFIAQKVAGKTGAEEAAASGQPPQAGYEAGIQELDNQQAGAGGFGQNPIASSPFAQAPDQF